MEQQKSKNNQNDKAKGKDIIPFSNAFKNVDYSSPYSDKTITTEPGRLILIK